MKNQVPLPSDHMFHDEGTLLSECIKWLAPQERDGVKVLRICDRYQKGYSDLFICVHGAFVIAELKDDTGTPTPHQIQFIQEMWRCGAIGGVCRTVQDVAKLVDYAKKHSPRHKLSDDEKRVYLCDPDKNERCTRRGDPTWCGRECIYTLYRSYAKE